MTTRFRFISLAVVTIFLGAPASLKAVEAWQKALGQMAFPSVSELNRTNCVELMLGAFQSNDVVKALIFMPGATDEFYMFRRAKAVVTNQSPSLLDAVAALTHQTYIRATFQPPLLLLHTDEDPLDPLIRVDDERAAARLRAAKFVPYGQYNDRDWEYLQPILSKKLKADVWPLRHMYDSWHFYRHSFTAWNLTGWEAVEAIALAGKTRVTVANNSFPAFHRVRLIFEGDERVRATPKIESFPR